MSSLSGVLTWKFNNPPGIRTRDKVSGGMEIFDWPTAALGPEPTAAQIATWTTEFDALPPIDLIDEEIGNSKVLKGLVRMLAKDKNVTVKELCDAIKAEL